MFNAPWSFRAMRSVRCYWNLHRNCWSVQDARTRRVIGHATRILLDNAVFKVSEAGRARVLAERKKNVHAFACGALYAADWLDDHTFDWTSGDNAYVRYAKRAGRVVSYNPFKGASLVTVDDGAAISSAPMLALCRQMAKAHVLAFDPLQMTEAESAAATV
jgi:hypothetical protein